MRTPLAVLGAAALAALGGAILGEYTLNGFLAIVGGLLYGLVVGEVVVAVERRPSPLGSVAATVFPPVGWGWSLWISNGHHLHYATWVQWLGALVGAVAGLVWTVTGRRVVDGAVGPADPGSTGGPGAGGESS